MPPKWSRKPDPNDPAYRRLGDRINFALHVALFSAVNSGAWFATTLYQTEYQWLNVASAVWASLLLAHAVYIFALADYSESA